MRVPFTGCRAKLHRVSPAARAAPILSLLAVLVGCTGDRIVRRPIEPLRDVHAPNPTRRSKAVSALSRSTGKREAVRTLIETLRDEDPSIRLQAIAELETETGEDSAYRPFDSQTLRRRHVEAWLAWWRREIKHPDPLLLAPPIDAPSTLPDVGSSLDPQDDGSAESPVPEALVEDPTAP